MRSIVYVQCINFKKVDNHDVRMVKGKKKKNNYCLENISVGGYLENIYKTLVKKIYSFNLKYI